MWVSTPKRKRNRKAECRDPPLVIKYRVRKTNGEEVPVCAETFRGITCVVRKRINLIAKYYRETGSALPERRGGSRRKPVHVQTEESITEWIKKYKCRESHYGRGKSVRKYLPPELTVMKMWRDWKHEQRRCNLPVSSYSKFYQVFSVKFNLGFGNPRQDVCSFCEVQRNKVNSEKDARKKQEYMTQFRLHKLRAKKFYQIMREKAPGVISVCFDMQQNQPIPKLSVGEVFYARQVWLYNLTFVRNDLETQDKSNVQIYTWLETESGRGANQVASCLLDYLGRLEEEMAASPNKPSVLRLFSDACSSQNKNTVMICAVKYFQQKSAIFDVVEHFFSYSRP